MRRETTTELEFTYRDLEEIPEGSLFRYEIVDGELLVSPAPFVIHQLVLLNLYNIIYAHVRAKRLGIVLVVEVLSKGTAKRDRTIKKAVYERFGVRALLDPRPRRGGAGRVRPPRQEARSKDHRRRQEGLRARLLPWPQDPHEEALVRVSAVGAPR